jgi:hypothetical protein
VAAETPSIVVVLPQRVPAPPSAFGRSCRRYRRIAWNASRMGHLDLSVDLFVVASPERVAGAVHDRSHWGRWWPDLELTVTEDRGTRGLRWATAGAVVGSAELWVEPALDGAVLHWYLRGEAHRDAGVRKVTRRRAAWLRVATGLKDQLEGGRPPGVKPGADVADE